jgi:two-component system CheB/CheR fusion protein
LPVEPKTGPRTQASATITDSEARLRAVFDTAVEGIVTMDDHGTIDSINPAAGRMFGWTTGELIGRNISTLMPEPYRSRHDGHLAQYRHSGERRIIGIGREVFGRRKDGTVFPIDLSVGEFTVGGRRLFTGILRDITERRRLQSEVLRIAEVSQQRIGQDLHDDLCQQLAGIEFMAQTLASRLHEARRPEAAAADEVAALVRSATEYTRNLSHGMSPLRPAPDSLVSALEELALRTARHFDVQVDFHCPAPVPLPDVQVATHVYRVAQEAVSNALRHGKARRIELHILRLNDELRLHVRDHGQGLPARPPKSSGMGLRIMQYRAGIIGGTIVIQRESSGGTSVTCTVPLAPPHAHAPRPTHEERPPKQARTRPPHPPRR